MRSLVPFLHQFPQERVLVIGDAILDSYLDGDAERLSREGPVPVVRLRSRRDCPGGTANVAVNLAMLGGQVRLVSVVGADEQGELLTRLLRDQHVDVDLVVDPSLSTPWLQRIRAGGHLIARLDRRSTAPTSASTQRALVERVEEQMAQADVVVVSDYEHGVLSDEVVAAIERHRHGKIIVVDAKRPALYRRLRPTAVTPNWSEALGLLGPLPLASTPASDDERADVVAAHGERVLEATQAEIAAITLDRDGAIVVEPGRPPYRTFTTPVDDGHAAGAGDTFLAAFALALGVGGEAPEAAELASAGAVVVVTQQRTVACRADDLETQLLGGVKVVRDDEQLAPLAERLRASGKRSVFTNGCFDLLHRGHITYLNRAKTLGDVLIVGVNSDESVHRLKGPSRPINALEDRIGVLVALSCVDYVVPFDAPTPERVLQLMRPDRYVKGGDYTRETLPEAPLLAELGTHLDFLPLVEDWSTSGLIDRIRDDSTAG